MTHLEHTCSAMVRAQTLLGRVAEHQRVYLARGDAEHAEAAQHLVQQHHNNLAKLGMCLRLHSAANDSTILPGAA